MCYLQGVLPSFNLLFYSNHEHFNSPNCKNSNEVEFLEIASQVITIIIIIIITITKLSNLIGYQLP